jgi:cysteine-S-conjugate beta-lyase
MDASAAHTRLAQQRTSAKWRAYPADVLPAWIAEMDVDLAPVVAEALHAAIERSDTGYRWPGDLASSLASFMDRHFGWHVEADAVLVLPDVLTGMAEAVRAVTADTDSVVITPPIYPPFFSVTRTIARRGIVEVPLVDDAVDLEGLEVAFARPEVTAYLMCHPHNPTGYVADESTLRQIALLARTHGVTVISDEIWSPLTWAATPAAFVPYLSFDPELTAPDIALVSASKAFNLAGLKCAQLVAGSAHTAARVKASIPMEVTYGTGHLGIIASDAAYRAGDDWLTELVALLAANAALLGRELAEHLPEIGYRQPSATYLAWLDCRPLGLGDDPAAVFLEHGRVALNAGHLYGDVGKGFVRVNFATDPALITEIVRRMATAVREVRGG